MLWHYELCKTPEQNLMPGRSQHPLSKADISLASLVVLALEVTGQSPVQSVEKELEPGAPHPN